MNACPPQPRADERDALEAAVARYAPDSPAAAELSTLVTCLRSAPQMPAKWRQTIVELIQDSLTGLTLEIVHEARRIADLGTGCGIPGLVLAAALPRARFTLVDRDPQGIAFIDGAITAMGLGNVDTVVTDISRWADEHAGEFDLVVSRNVRPVNIMTGAAKILRAGGHTVLWGGEKAAREPEITDPDPTTGLRSMAVEKLESMGKQRYLFVYERAPW